jgi:SAM-dependent methyltransferase
MSTDTAANSAALRAARAFFEKHATEAAADVRGYLPWLKPWLQAESVRLLDFGARSGSFISRLLSTLFFDPRKLHLSIVEPDEAARRSFLIHLPDFTAHPIREGPALPENSAAGFDVILANHALPYVSDLDRTVRTLLDALASPGLLVTTMAGRDNLLSQLRQHGFSLLGKPVPYHTAEELEAVLGRLRQPFEKHHLHYDLAFPDSPENRLEVLRVLFTAHLDQLPRQQALALFNPYAQLGKVTIHTGHGLYAIRR